MPAFQKSYRNIEEFEREEIRPSFRIGFSFSDLVHEAEFEGEILFDQEDEFAHDRLNDDREEEEDDDEDDDDDDRGAEGGAYWGTND